MLEDEGLLRELKRLIEQKLSWGDSSAWVNQDFIALSKKMQEETGAAISHITLKRIWGKVKYEGLPQVYTLNTLSKFVGYESWRDFIVNKDEGCPATAVVGYKTYPEGSISLFSNRWLISAAAFSLLVIVLAVIAAPRRKITPKDYKFSSHTTTGNHIPNSVVFDYDAKKSPDDSVVIQQSWDKKLRTVVSKNQHQHTLIYYYPGFFQPKLLVAGQVVKEHDLLIPSDGWVTAIMRSPMPVYFKKEEVVHDGRLALSAAEIKAQHIELNPDVLSVSYCNVKDFGPVYSDDFEFETSVRNDFKEGSSVCQVTNIYLLCEGSAIGIPLCARGCESALNFFFTDYAVSGKQKDLSAFGVDFKDFARIRVRSSKGTAEIFLNDKLVYRVEKGIMHARIIGIDYVFQGTGSVDYSRLRNASVSFDDEF